MRNWDLSTTALPLRLGAVSYLNTVPLIWGMLNGPQRPLVDLSFDIPAICAEKIESGEIQAGLAPVAEIARQELEIVPGVCIAARGPVRSILLFSRVPWREVRTLAADSSSRTSVQLARVILKERFGAEPTIIRQQPNLQTMLAAADAALIIGDPALVIDPAKVNYECLDLAEQWVNWTGLPMVFAAWSGKPGIPVERIAAATVGSYRFGQEHLDEIVDQQFSARQIARELADRYLRQHLHFELGSRELAGLEAFLRLAGLKDCYVG